MTEQGPSRRQRLVVIAAAGVATALGFLDQTIIGVALPTISRDLGLSAEQAVWVVEAYLIPLAVFAVAFGALSRRTGTRALFTGGVLGFVAGSLSAGLATDGTWIIVSRFAQGTAAAAMFTASQALVADAFPKGQRGRGIGGFVALTALALSLGPLIGGALISTVGWRAVFLVNPILAIATLPYLLGFGRTIEEEQRQTEPSRFDWPGLALLVPGLTVLVWSLIGSGNDGWSAAEAVGLAAGLVLLGAFWSVEHRVEAPLLDLDLLTHPAVRAGLAVVGAIGFVQMWGIITIPAHLQLSLGLSAFVAGAALLPLTLSLVGSQFVAGWAVDRRGPRAPIVGGLVLSIVGLAAIALGATADSYAAMVPGFVVGGLGLALSQTPANTATMNAVDINQRTEVSGLLGTVRQTSALLGLAALGALGSLADGGGSSTHASTGALVTGLVGGGVVVAVALVYVMAVLPKDTAGAATGSDR